MIPFKNLIEQVPSNIKEEVEALGLKITSVTGTDDEPVIAVGLSLPVKGNTHIIKELESKGWKKTFGRVAYGKRVSHYEKTLKTPKEAK